MDYVIALVPPIGLLLILVVIVRAFLGADRAERDAERKFRAEHPELDLAPLPPGRSTVAGATAADDASSAGRPAAPAARTGAAEDGQDVGGTGSGADAPPVGASDAAGGEHPAGTTAR